MQKLVRMHLCRKRFRILKEEVLEIQRNFKGFIARQNHLKEVKGKSEDLNYQFFEYHLTIIQRMYNFLYKTNQMEGF